MSSALWGTRSYNFRLSLLSETFLQNSASSLELSLGEEHGGKDSQENSEGAVDTEALTSCWLKFRGTLDLLESLEFRCGALVLSRVSIRLAQEEMSQLIGWIHLFRPLQVSNRGRGVVLLQEGLA